MCIFVQFVKLYSYSEFLHWSYEVYDRWVICSLLYLFCSGQKLAWYSLYSVDENMCEPCALQMKRLLINHSFDQAFNSDSTESKIKPCLYPRWKRKEIFLNNLLKS